MNKYLELNQRILIGYFSSINEIERAKDVFHSIKDKNAVSYICMMKAYNDCEMYGDMLNIFKSNEFNEMKVADLDRKKGWSRVYIFLMMSLTC